MDRDGALYIEDQCDLFHRESGVLLDIPSLPGAYGIGEFGPHAIKFIKLLRDTGQRLWHILSLRETIDANHTKANTSYGWNTDLISFAWLRDDHLITLQERDAFLESMQSSESPQNSLELRRKFLKEVARHFLDRASSELLAEFMRFKKYNRLWLEKFSLFCSLKDELQLPWYSWPDKLRYHDKEAIDQAKIQLKESILNHEVLQFLASRDWKRIRSAANYDDVRIILSMPVHVAYDSYEVWSRQDLFFIGDQGEMTVSAGTYGCNFHCPAYRWSRVKSEQYRFWVNRFRRELQNVDIVSIEHFGMLFEAEEFAETENHRSIPTSDRGLIDHVREILNSNNLIASEHYFCNNKTDREIKALNIGNAVALPSSFSKNKAISQVFPKDYSARSIAYTSDFMSPTLLSWIKSFRERITAGARGELQRCFGTDLSQVCRNALNYLARSNAGAVMTTLPDLLEIEMNSDYFFNWRFGWDQINDQVKTRLLQFANRD